MNPNRLERLGAAIALAFACASAAQAAPTYHLVDLGIDTYATAINAHGTIVGQVDNGRAAVWRDGTWHRKGQGRWAEDIDDGGDIVGNGQDENNQYHSYEWPHGGAVFELTAPAPLTGPLVSRIGGDGSSAGFAYDAAGLARCVRWVGGVGQDLGIEGDSCYVSGVDRHGAIAGTVTASTVPYEQQAFLWRDGVLQLLGTGPGIGSASGRMNAKGHLSGTLQMHQHDHLRPTHAALWNGRKWIDLGTLAGTGSSDAAAVNDADEIVGSSETAAGGPRHGFLHAGGQMYDLVDLVDNGAGWTFEFAADINDDGVIVGTNRLEADGHDHAFMLVPLTR